MLFKGKRTVLNEDKNKLIELGKLLASKTKKMIFRSGNANGSDQLFCDGISENDNKRLPVVTPYTGHSRKSNIAAKTYSINEIDIAAEPEIIYQSKMKREIQDLL